MTDQEKQRDRYVIEHISDFLLIPEEKLDKCLGEFCKAVKAAKATEGAMDAIAKAIYSTEAGIRCRLPKMVWVDDDMGTITIDIKTPENGPSGQRVYWYQHGESK